MSKSNKKQKREPEEGVQIEPYIKRMQDEDKALRAKMYALDGFLKNKASSVTSYKANLMRAQLATMRDYHKILAERIQLELE